MTIKEVKNNPVQIGDFVKVVKGGTAESRDLIWLVIDVNQDGEHRKHWAKIRLVSGTYNQYGKSHEVGYEVTLRMTSLKKIDVIVKEKIA